MINVSYPHVLNLFQNHLVKGRAESASFLIWYLENYYRLDTLEAIDSVCDQNGDKGVDGIYDGIYINEAIGTIDIFQTKISQTPTKTIGDTLLKEFYGTLSQFANKKSVKDIIDTGGDAQVVGLIKRLRLIDILDQYKIRGVFITNVELDANGSAYLKSRNEIEFIGKNKLETTFISDERDVPKDLNAKFDISDVHTLKYYGDINTLALIAPIRAVELVNMPGISNQLVFAYNVRGPLGKTNVNKDIVKSIKNKATHKNFPLFHNGITIITNSIEEKEGILEIETFFVVNGCQSLTALYDNKASITGDLRVLTKFIQVSVDSELSKIITHYSNNQNGVKSRDFKSNNFIQIRLQNEFSLYYKEEYFYEVKRGEHTNELSIISNEMAGIYLMAFDIKEPWNTPFRNQLFDEKYSDLFGRPEVTAHRIVMLHLIHNVIDSNMYKVNNQLVSKYALTRYAIMFMLRNIIESDNEGRLLLSNPEKYIHDSKKRSSFMEIISSIVDDIIVDFNGELDNLGEGFDYRSRLRNEEWVKRASQDVVGSYLKLVNRGRIDSFEKEWNNQNLN